MTNIKPMAYRNQRELAELEEDDHNDEVEKNLKEPVVTKEEETWKNRYGDLRRHQMEEAARLKDELAQLRKQMDGVKQGTLRPPKSAAEILEWKTEYPDFADVLDTWIKEEIKLSTTDIKRQTDEIKKEKALLNLKKKHPDADDIFKDPAFHEWMEGQTPRLKEIIYASFDVDDASTVLDKYKIEHKRKSRSRDDSDDARENAKVVKTKNTVRFDDEAGGDYEFSESQIERESAKNPRWWDANEDKIMEAQRKGRVLLDLSGGAR
jgi:hypothetical protein